MINAILYGLRQDNAISLMATNQIIEEKIKDTALISKKRQKINNINLRYYVPRPIFLKFGSSTMSVKNAITLFKSSVKRLL